MKRNIIWFMVDSLKSDYLYSNGDMESKNTFLDQLMSEGAFFSNCITAAPYTITSIASIFTSTYPNVHGIDGWFKLTPNHLSKNIVTFADVLKYEGYYNACYYPVTSRAYVPPYSFDKYELTSNESEFNFDFSLEKEKFIMLDFEDIHDDCIRLGEGFTKQEYRNSVNKISDKIEFFYNKLCKNDDIIIISSDHGVRCVDEVVGAHKESVTGTYLTDKTIKSIFCIIDRKNIKKSMHITSMVRSIDVAPTILDYADLEILRAQGRSLRPLIEGGSDQVNFTDYAFSQTGGMNTSPWKSNTWSIRTNDWKYVLTQNKKLFSNSLTQELYSLISDPNEINNLVGVHANTANALKVILEKELLDHELTPEKVYSNHKYDYTKIINKRTYVKNIMLKVFLFNSKYKVKRTKLIFRIFAKKIILRLGIDNYLRKMFR